MDRYRIRAISGGVHFIDAGDGTEEITDTPPGPVGPDVATPGAEVRSTRSINSEAP